MIVLPMIPLLILIIRIGNDNWYNSVNELELERYNSFYYCAQIINAINIDSILVQNKRLVRFIFNSLRDTVFHALDTGNLVRALQEERASVLLNTFLLEPENEDAKRKSKEKETNLLKEIDDVAPNNSTTSKNKTRNCDIQELSLSLSLAERYYCLNSITLVFSEE